VGDTGGRRSQATVPPCAASSAVPYDSHSNICLYGNRHAARRQHIRGKRMQLAQNLRSQGTAHCNMSEEAPRMYRAPSPLPHATIEAHQRLSDRWEDASEIRVKRCEQFEPGKPGHVKPHLPLTVSSRQRQTVGQKVPGVVMSPSFAHFYFHLHLIEGRAQGVSRMVKVQADEEMAYGTFEKARSPREPCCFPCSWSVLCTGPAAAARMASGPPGVHRSLHADGRLGYDSPRRNAASAAGRGGTL
jgi:hypothetical protein